MDATARSEAMGKSMGTALAGSHSRAEDRATAELETCQLGAYGMLHTATLQHRLDTSRCSFPYFSMLEPDGNIYLWGHHFENKEAVGTTPRANRRCRAVNRT